ncbi:MAG: branched-chain amino acid ABC transporter permease [Desulfobacterales bacterium]|nr:branched-chain amino acid ABC transporter permease [Desulfobacterales bacterium]MBS3754329.1 branched-chain amino acid ABC transporter permease [Desulfobacterales bacterium]
MKPDADNIRKGAYAAVAVLWILAPLYLDKYWTDVLNNVAIYAALGLSLNIILGYGGMFHMGHAAFFAIGAYTTAIVNTAWGVPVLWLMPFAGIAAGVFAVAVARPIIHLRGDYLLIVTIGMVEIVRIALVNNVFGITGGANGIFGISSPSIFGRQINGVVAPGHYFYLLTVFLGATIILFSLLEHSRFGRALKFTCSDEVAATGSGINAAGYKLAAFVIGAVWAGMTGTLYAAKIGFISPESFSFWESVIMFMIVILGGSGSIPGVLLGAILIIGLPELFQGLQQYRLLIFGIVLVVMMIFRPQGILPPAPRKYPVDKLEKQEVSL